MNAEIYRVSFDQFNRLLGEQPGRDVILSAAKLCEDILVGMWADEPLVFIGLSPPTILSEEAYAWMVVTPAGEGHRFLLARYARGVLETILGKYPVIFGHCFNAKSARWLKILGAEFTTETTFKFRRETNG